MAITRLSNSGIATGGVLKYDSAAAGYPPVMAAPTAADGGTGTTATVSFTAVSGATTYTALSSPGSFTATGASSPLTVSGLTAGTAYTFQIRANNSVGSGPYSAASNSVTPVVPGAFDSIASVTPTSGTSVIFSNIPQTYTHLQLRSVVRTSAVQTSWTTIALYINGNESAVNYRYSYLEGTGNNANVTGSYGDGGFVASGAYYTGSPSDYFGVGIVDFMDYVNTGKLKTLRSFWGANNGTSTTSNNILRQESYAFNSTSAITQIELRSPNGSFVSGTTFSLYGIKGS